MLEALQEIKGLATKRIHAQKGDILRIISVSGRVYIVENERTKERFSVTQDKVRVLENKEISK